MFYSHINNHIFLMAVIIYKYYNYINIGSILKDLRNKIKYGVTHECV